MGSPPSLAAGSCSWSSGIVYPLQHRVAQAAVFQDQGKQGVQGAGTCRTAKLQRPPICQPPPTWHPPEPDALLWV